MPKRLTLDEIRNRHHLTQEALAKKAGISRITIAKLELGQHNPTQETKDKLAAVLGEQVYRARYAWAKEYVKRGRPRTKSETT